MPDLPPGVLDFAAMAAHDAFYGHKDSQISGIGLWREVAKAVLSAVQPQCAPDDLPDGITCDGELHWTQSYDHTDPGENGEAGPCPKA